MKRYIIQFTIPLMILIISGLFITQGIKYMQFAAILAGFSSAFIGFALLITTLHKNHSQKEITGNDRNVTSIS